MYEIVAAELAVNVDAATPNELFANLDPHITEIERKLTALGQDTKPL